MKKHLFTIRWEREGRVAYPTFEAYLAFDWPDNIPPDVALNAAAKIRGISKQSVMERVIKTLPPECNEAMQALRVMHLRSRYSPETEGPFLVTDPEGTLTEEQLLMWVEHSKPAELRAYRV